MVAKKQKTPGTKAKRLGDRYRTALAQLKSLEFSNPLTPKKPAPANLQPCVAARAHRVPSSPGLSLSSISLCIQEKSAASGPTKQVLDVCKEDATRCADLEATSDVTAKASDPVCVLATPATPADAGTTRMEPSSITPLAPSPAVTVVGTPQELHLKNADAERDDDDVTTEEEDEEKDNGNTSFSSLLTIGSTPERGAASQMSNLNDSLAEAQSSVCAVPSNFMNLSEAPTPERSLVAEAAGFCTDPSPALIDPLPLAPSTIPETKQQQVVQTEFRQTPLKRQPLLDRVAKTGAVCVPSPIKNLEIDYGSDYPTLSQAQVDVQLKALRQELEQKHAVMMGLLEEQLQDAVREKDAMLAQQEQVDALVSQFEKTCEDVAAAKDQEIQKTRRQLRRSQAALGAARDRATGKEQKLLAKHREELAAVKRELETAQKEIIARDTDARVTMQTCTQLRTQAEQLRAANAPLREELASRAAAMTVLKAKVRKAEKHSRKCDERYTAHMKEAKKLYTSTKQRLDDAAAKLKATEAEQMILKAKAESAEDAAKAQADRIQRLQFSADTANENATSFQLRAQEALSAKASVEKDFKSLEQQLADMEALSSRNQQLEQEKADLVQMCEELMNQADPDA